ncbi:MAG: hypothetical protein KatS3mg024_2018 [Armatimonadota bacterium]|nr:MAG: hypothetical protein KatS3mg024_2018 [Armatimonadota bacterium]
MRRMAKPGAFRWLAKRNRGRLAGGLEVKDGQLCTRNPTVALGNVLAARRCCSKREGSLRADAEENIGKRTGGGIIPGPRQAIVRRRSRTEVQAIGWRHYLSA